MDDPGKLRELAAWYREFAETAGSRSIWEARLRMADDLEREETGSNSNRRRSNCADSARFGCPPAGQRRSDKTAAMTPVPSG